MANELTGDYEAVLQVSIRQVNGLLATLHQNGDIPLKSPHLPHALSMTLGEGASGSSLSPGIAGLSTWIAGQKLWHDSGTFKVYREKVPSVAAPGVAVRLAEAITAIEGSLQEIIGANMLHGRADVQVASPTISLDGRSASEVTVHASIRANYEPAKGTQTMPDPIHGDVHIGYEITQGASPQGQQLLKVTPSANDGKIYFSRHPGTSTSASESDQITAEVRNIVRSRLKPLDFPLSSDFPFAAFRGLGDAIVLPMQLSGGLAPAAGLGSVNNLFIGGSDYAIAVSKDHIAALLAPLMDAVKTSIGAFSVQVTIMFVTGTYHASFTSGPTLEWKAGVIEISGNVALTTGSVLPNGYVNFKQGVALALDAATQIVTLKAAGDPVVDESWFISHNTAMGAVKSAVANALASAAASVNATFANTRAKFNAGLKSFDDSAEARYDAVEITPHGIVIRGSISTRYHYSPIVDVRETPDGKSFTALHSWIPGGRIDRFIWTWVKNHQIPWFSQVKQRVEEHRFILEKPAGVQSLKQICLKIEGAQTDANGFEQGIVAGKGCQVSEREPILVQPPWWDVVYLPIWWPRPPEEVLEEIIAGYVNVQGELAPAAGRGINTLVRFASLEMEQPLGMLQRALVATSTTRSHPLSVVWVLPSGTFRRTNHHELESRIRSLGDEFPASLELAEDIEGGWRRTFAAGDGPSTFLMNARGEFVWKQESEENLDEMVQALHHHLTPALAPSFKPLSLAIGRGSPVPDFHFVDQYGRQQALHRFRGREVLLLFWQSWSVPCRKELQRCQRLSTEGVGKGDALEIIGLHGGPDAEAIHTVSKELGIQFSLAQDGEHRIARMLGVRCWPTTVRIGRDGAIRDATFGLLPDLEAESSREPSSAESS